jgi:hypothetical protein
MRFDARDNLPSGELPEAMEALPDAGATLAREGFTGPETARWIVGISHADTVRGACSTSRPQFAHGFSAVS